MKKKKRRKAGMKRTPFIAVVLVLLVQALFYVICISQTGGPAAAYGATDKMALWKGATKLRGANIFQRRVYPAIDGTEFMGSGCCEVHGRRDESFGTAGDQSRSMGLGPFMGAFDRRGGCIQFQART
jgi:hypothetical protein